jgi:hypothetical protein
MYKFVLFTMLFYLSTSSPGIRQLRLYRYVRSYVYLRWQIGIRVYSSIKVADSLLLKIALELFVKKVNTNMLKSVFLKNYFYLFTF